MPSLARKIEFAEKHIRAPDGKRFSLKGRAWVVDQLWRPLDGWKLWPVNSDRLCKKCSARANTIVEDFHESDKTRTKAHKKTKCDGLTSEPILIAAVELKRQQGKTFNTAALALSRGFLDESESIALLAGSEDQVARLYNKNYRRTIKQSAALTENCIQQGTAITFPGTGSDIEILPTAISSVGDTRTMVIVDECRIVPPDIAVAMIATLFARGGWQCPDHHIRTHEGVEDDEAPRVCGVCKKKTVPWYGKALLLSSAGEQHDNEKDWFFEFVDHHKKEPHPNVHVFSSTENLNPSISKKMVEMTEEVFGALDSTKAFAGIEAGGERLRRGEDVVTAADVKRICDRNLRNEQGSGNRCVGFLDTSTTGDKTSLVIIADDEELSSEPWENVYLSHLKYWDPKKLKPAVINPDDVQKYVQTLLPLYPNLEIFEVDAKIGAQKKDTKALWPVLMMRALKNGKDRWRQKVATWKGGKAESQAGWDQLEARILKQTFRSQDDPEFKRELKGVKRDRNRNVVDRNRGDSHKDITEGIACAMYRISLLQFRAASRSSMAELEERRNKTARVARPKPLTFTVDGVRWSPDSF